MAPAHHEGAYGFTRVLGTFPLPAFLLLAGAAVTWRVHAARERKEDARDVRRALFKRGLQVCLYGYLMSASYALLDGWQGLETFLRADVLHVIGLSIAAGALMVGATLSPRSLALRALGFGALLTAICPFVSDLAIPGALRPLAGLFVDAPPYTRMPLVPLFAWFAVGSGAAAFMLARRGDDPASARAGTPRSAIAILALVGVVCWAGGFALTGTMHEALGGPLTRSHPAVWANVLDLAGRGLVVLAVGAALSLVLPARPRRALVRLGRGSLVAYVVHVPFCYGRLGGDLVGSSSMATASAALVLLVALSWGSVYAWDAFKARIRPRKWSAA
ncbi:MAG: heparan-alpha-glucosaminide N-acetyltransferase domain-containing protein [Myxococcota bacterium]